MPELFDRLLPACVRGDAYLFHAISGALAGNQLEQLHTLSVAQKKELLFYAISSGTKEIAATLMSAFATFTFTAEDKLQDKFFDACASGHTDMALFLLDHGANIKCDRALSDKDTPINFAAGRESLTVIALLDRLNDDPQIAEIKGRAFLFACTATRPQQYTFNYDETRSFRNGGLLAQAMLMRYSDIDFTLKNAQGKTAFLVAAERGLSDVVLEIIACHDPEEPNVDALGNTALHLAASKGHLAVLQALAQSPHVNYYQHNQDENSAAHVAVLFGKEAFARQLINVYKIDVNHKNKQGKTLLHLLNDRGDIGMISGNPIAYEPEKCLSFIRFLCKHGAKINQPDNDNYTLLMRACASEKKAVLVQSLLNSQGINTECLGPSGNTALSIACMKGHLSIVKMLTQKGAKVDHCNQAGFTPFMLACGFGQKAVAKYLFESGRVADINQKSRHGLSALTCASNCTSVEKKESMVRWLSTLPGIDTNITSDIRLSETGRSILSSKRPLDLDAPSTETPEEQDAKRRHGPGRPEQP